MAIKCEDYPCCGHTDGLPCDWTYTPAAQEYDSLHFGCEHEHGFCEVDERERDMEMTFTPDDSHLYDPMEDQWLDGSYEE